MCTSRVQFDPVAKSAIFGFGLSRQGYSHSVNHPAQPCQDNVMIHQGSFRAEPVLALAVADGHGSARYDRSDVGSYLALAAVLECFQEFVVMTASRAVEELPVLFRNEFARMVKRNFDRRVAVHAGVQAYSLESTPFLVMDFIRQAQSPDAARKKKHPPIDGETIERYGTTLQFVGMARGRVFAASIGDGAILFWHANGSFGGFEEVFPESGPSIGSDTHSLCSGNAVFNFRTQCVDADSLAGVFLCTDGVVNSYAQDADLHAMLRSIMENVRRFGAIRAAEVLPPFLDEVSRKGSGDDVTLAGLLTGRCLAAASREDTAQAGAGTAVAETAAAEAPEAENAKDEP